jgi:hypothetical protein
MSTDFDPYHRWLGIRPEEHPADHYRLLGLVRFEDDPEVIRDAAERQMGHVRRYALGQHSALSQRILNEVGAAKACLSDRSKKANYDRRLRAMAEAEPKAPPVAPPRRATVPSARASDAVPAIAPATTSSAQLRTAHTGQPMLGHRPRRWVSAAIVLAALALAGTIAYAFWRSPGERPGKAREQHSSRFEL